MTRKLPAYRRPVLQILLRRLREKRRFIQVLAGPRQAGKTTVARQALDEIGLLSHYASADDPALRDRAWLETAWETGRLRAGDSRRGAVLVLDEAQKIPAWSEMVKRLWDEDTAAGTPLRVVVLGSAPLLVQRGLTESLAGRFELIHITHWSIDEMRDAFGFGVEEFVFLGGYPGAAAFVPDRTRWAAYVRDSLIETTISRDVLLLSRIDKPALLRQVFRVACDSTGQVLSYTKMLGQLQDAGNTTTLAHYLELLAGAGLVTGLQKFSGSRVRQRGSSPKLLALNTALVTSQWDVALSQANREPERWGRLVETAVGAHLVNSSMGTGIDVLYWRDRNREVDFVLRKGRQIAAIEVTTGRRKDTRGGLDVFREEFRPRRTLLVGAQGIPVEDFLQAPAASWLS